VLSAVQGTLRQLSVFALATTLLVGGAPACEQKEPEKRPTADFSSQPVVIGVSAALDGSLADFGKGIRKGALVAESLLNSNGGVRGHRVEVRIGNDMTANDQAQAVADGFIKAYGTEYVVGVVGPTGSPQAEFIHRAYAEAGLILISSSAATPTLSAAQEARQRFFFRTTPSHALQARALALLALGPPKGTGAICKKASVVFADDAFGKPIAERFQEEFTKRGGSVIGTPQGIPTDEKQDYKVQAEASLAAIKAAGTGTDVCQLLVAFPPAGAAYMRKFRELTKADASRDWTKFATIGANGLAQASFISKAKNDPNSTSEVSAAEGMYGVQPESNPNTPEFAYFKKLYQLSFPGETPPIYASNTFDAVILLALATQKAGLDENTNSFVRDALFDVSAGGRAYGPSELASALGALRRGEDIDYNGASGKVDFDDRGDVIADYTIWKVVQGALVSKYEERISAEALQDP
jgi:branched-chain amino acid transport system substrate-binding protein